MVTLKMSDEDSKLLLKPLMDYVSKNRPVSYGGSFQNNPPINEEEWLRLTELVDRLYHLKTTNEVLG
jgi:hypothetical protein